MKTVRYSRDALKDLKRYGNASERIFKAMSEYAATGAHANNVTRLVGSSASRMRVGDYRVIFEESQAEVFVTKVAPRGSVYG